MGGSLKPLVSPVMTLKVNQPGTTHNTVAHCYHAGFLSGRDPLIRNAARHSQDRARQGITRHGRALLYKFGFVASPRSSQRKSSTLEHWRSIQPQQVEAQEHLASQFREPESFSIVCSHGFLSWGQSRHRTLLDPSSETSSKCAQTPDLGLPWQIRWLILMLLEESCAKIKGTRPEEGNFSTQSPRENLDFLYTISVLKFHLSGYKVSQ